MALAYAKHRMLVATMRNVYALFSVKPQYTAQAGTSPEKSSSGGQDCHSQIPESRSQPTQKGVKRQKRDRDSPPPDDRNGKRGKGSSADSNLRDRKRFLACPFNKFDSHRYCTNDDTLAIYRLCAGPGFKSISYLKYVSSLSTESTIATDYLMVGSIW